MNATFTFNVDSPEFRKFMFDIGKSIISCSHTQIEVITTEQNVRAKFHEERKLYEKKHPVRHFFSGIFWYTPADIKLILDELYIARNKTIQLNADLQKMNELYETVNNYQSSQVTVSQEIINLVRKYSNE